LGIAQDNPQLTPLEECRYDVCIVIPDNFTIDNNVNECKLYGGYYAVFKIVHTAEEMQKAWNEIFPYLIKNGYNIE
jgi:DNA gyrase inhibitor GyrI